MENLSQNNNLESPEKEPAPLEVLRNELADLKKAELAKKEKGENYDPHFEEFYPADLSNDDLELYRLYKIGQLTMDELRKIQGSIRFSQENYREHILGGAPEEKQPQAKYNSSFLGWIINKAMDMEYGKELKKAENEEK